MKKIFTIIMVILLTGCSSGNDKEVVDYPDIHIEYYYVDGCGMCEAFSTEGIPILEEEFGDALTITRYSMDDAQTKQAYDDSLANIDVEQFDTGDYYGLAPLIIVDGEFAKLGIYAGEYDELANDIKRAINDEPLGEDLEYDRALFK